MLRGSPRKLRWWLAVVQVVLLMATYAVPAAATTTDSAPLTGTQLIELLRSYGIVKGDQQGNLLLDRPISRGEMITIMVRSLGGEEESKLYQDVTSFPDSRGHWSNGAITWASVRKLVKGDDKGFVRPKDPISYAEALTLVLRVVEQEPTGGTWPMNIVLKAAELGILPEGVNIGNVTEPAIRGLIFQSMGKALVTVKDAEGTTYLQKNVDHKPPLVVVNDLPATTPDAKIRVTGMAMDAAVLTVNGQTVVVNGGLYATEVALSYGENTITVIAQDLAGNTATETRKVTRSNPAASLDITGPDKVAPGGTAIYTITATDTAGNAMSTDGVVVKVEGNIGTFDKATGTLTVVNQAGATGKIVVTAGTLTDSINVTVMGLSAEVDHIAIDAINGGNSVAYSRPMTVTVSVFNAEGKLLEDDFGRAVTLTGTGLENISISPSVAYTNAGVATFTVRAAKTGAVTLTATSGTMAGTRVGVFGSLYRIRLISDPATVVATGVNTMARIKAELVDEDGNKVANNYGKDIMVELSTTSPEGYISDNLLVIAKGKATSFESANDGMYQAGAAAASVQIKGTIISGEMLTVDPATVAVKVPTAGPGTKLSTYATAVLVNAGQESTFVIRVVDADGNLIPTGNYAFQVKVETSYNEEKVNGVPVGMTVELGSSGLNPVSDGKAEGTTDDTGDVVGRTAGGMAVVHVTYDKPGKVTLTPILMGAATKAYTSDPVEGEAISSLSFTAEGASTMYQAAIGGIRLTANSSIGTDQDVAAIANSTAGEVTLNVTLTTAEGYPIPNLAKTVTLRKTTNNNATTPPTALSANTVDGKTSFKVRGTSTVNFDTYEVKVTVGLESFTDTINVYTVSAKPDQPVIASVRGYKLLDGGLDQPGLLNEVAPDEDGLEIQLYPMDEQWVQVKVFAEGIAAPVYTTPAIDLSLSDTRVMVPKSKLITGAKRYYVIVKNGFADSVKSELSPVVSNSTYTTGVSISSAKYDQVTKRLLISGTGFSTSTTAPDTVSPDLISIKDESTGKNLALSGARVTINSTTSMTLDLSLATEVDDAETVWEALKNADKYSGTDIYVVAQAGWYTKYNGQVAAADLTGNKVTPGARANYAVIDRANNRLYVYGEGFTTGAPQWSKMKLTYSGAPTTDQFTLNNYSPVRSKDTELVFTLNSTVAGKVLANGNYRVSLPDGWLSTDGFQVAAAGDLVIYDKVTLQGVSYNATTGIITITGSGFSGTVHPELLWLYDAGTHAQLDLTNATIVGEVTSTSIQLQLGDTDQTSFENLTNFNGGDIYLRGDAGWLVTAQNRDAAGIGAYDLRFPTRPMP